jgi:hypothetical protein
LELQHAAMQQGQNGQTYMQGRLEVKIKKRPKNAHAPKVINLLIKCRFG